MRSLEAGAEEGGVGASLDAAPPLEDGGMDAGTPVPADASPPSTVGLAPDANATSEQGTPENLDGAQGRDASTSDADASREGLADASREGLADAASSPPDAGAAACDPSRGPEIGRLGLQSVISSTALDGLTDAVQPPDSTDWYLVEQRGRISILRAGALLPDPFLDLTSEIALNPPPTYEDRGLVSLAFAPDYASSGRVYVSVTPTTGDQANLDLLLEFTRSTDNPDRADPNSRRTIVEVRGTNIAPGFPRNIHNGGRVTFGPDGMLYLSMGDGGGINCNDQEPGAPQDIAKPFGKLLRLDLSQPAPYGAADNPFVADGDPRVLHYGLRNAFRYSFDRLTGELYIGDVGQNRYEEIDHAPRDARGLNFGWAAYEGDSRDSCPNRQLRAGSTHTPPVFVIDRRASATSPFSDYNAIIGGVVYRGNALPQLAGAYVFGGYQGRRLGAFYQCGDSTSPITGILKSCDPNAPAAACLHSLGGAPVFNELRAIVEDHDGELYVVANGDSLLKVVADE